MLKGIDGNGPMVVRGGNNSRMPTLPWGRVVTGDAEAEIAEYLPIIDEIRRAVPNAPIFVLHDRFDTMSAIDRHGEFQRYLDGYAALQDRCQNPGPRGLLWRRLPALVLRP
jgi:hypothetical protein